MAGIVASFIVGCAAPSSAAVMTKASQEAMTPDQAVARLMEGNARFVSGRMVHRDLTAQAKETAKGQYPFAVVLCCVDSRSAPELIFDQGLGDMFVPRVAGNYVQPDLLGSMEFATKLMGSKVIVVVGHSECGAIKGACDDVQLGNLTVVMDALRPAVVATPGFQSDRTSNNAAFVQAVTEENVRLTISKMRRDSEIIRQLEASGDLKIVGAMHDLATGQVTLLR